MASDGADDGDDELLISMSLSFPSEDDDDETAGCGVVLARVAMKCDAIPLVIMLVSPWRPSVSVFRSPVDPLRQRPS